MIGVALAESIANGLSKKRACTEAGVVYSTFMRWQARKKNLRARIDEATQTCRKKRRRDVLFEGFLAQQLARFGSHRHDRRPYCNPNAQPVKWMKLIGVRSRNGKNRTLRPSKDHSIKGKRSRTRLQLVLRQNRYWKTNCLVMEVERSF